MNPIDFIEKIKSVMPHFLIGQSGQAWVTTGGLAWILGNGQSWFTGGNKMVAWLKSLIAPIQSLHSDYLAFEADMLYRVELTGQVIYLEHYLNDLFDPNERRIFISDAAPIFSDIIFNKNEGSESSIIYNKSEGENSILLYNKSELAQQNDFIINVPVAISLTAELITLISASVNQYKQAGSRYTIQSF